MQDLKDYTMYNYDYELLDEYDTSASIEQAQYVFNNDYQNHLLSIEFDEINLFYWRGIKRQINILYNNFKNAE